MFSFNDASVYLNIVCGSMSCFWVESCLINETLLHKLCVSDFNVFVNTLKKIILHFNEISKYSATNLEELPLSEFPNCLQSL